MLKNKWLIMSAFTLFSLCAVMFAGCTLEGDIETLRAKAAGDRMPTDVTATAASSSSITVSWNSVSSALGYNIYRSSSASGSYVPVGSSRTASYTDTGLSANTAYYYKVSIFDSNYEDGPQSAYASATTWPSSGGTPSTPTGVTATAASSSSITVSWSPVSGATLYYINRSSSASGNYTSIGYSSSTSYTDTGLSANTAYYYKVAAFNGDTMSSESAYASATTLSSSGSFTDLTSNIWHNDSLSPGAVHQYRLYASSASVGYDYYILWEDVDNSSYTADIKVGVKREGYSTYFVVPTDYGNTSQQNCIELYISWSGYYIIEVQGHDSSSSGSYSIAYNDYGHP